MWRQNSAFTPTDAESEHLEGVRKRALEAVPPAVREEIDERLRDDVDEALRLAREAHDQRTRSG